MRKLLLTFLIIYISACSHMQGDEKRTEVNELELITSSLLNENTSRYTYRNSNGELVFDELKEFKALETIYIKNFDMFKLNRTLTPSQLKTIMFFAFYSKERNSAAFQEYLAADLMPIFLENKKTFLKVLNSFPFLINSNCNRLNAFFGFEGENADKKMNFKQSNKALFSKVLNQGQFEQCWSSFQ